MAPVRLRHAKGVCTIDVSFEASSTVQSLLQEIYKATDIPPSRQILKVGYPPRALTIEPGLPIQSLGLQRGDQIIVAEIPDAPSRVAGPGPGPPTPKFSPPPSRPAVERVAPRAPAVIPPQAQSSGPDSVEVDGSFLVHRVVPDDNSCLFSSVALVFEQSISKASQIRKIVAEGIRKDPETYNEAILGMPPSQYISTISKPTSWGGAIELAILASHYSTEIASVDVESGRVDHFSPTPSEGEATTTTTMRAILLYSGIHYDAATLAPMVDAPDEWHQTLFPIKSTEDKKDPILVAAGKLADILRAKKAFTNTATFDLKCEQCGQGLKGEKGARAHAEQTGHVRFGEY